MNNEKDMLMNWDDAIETDGQEYILLPEGEYNFKVTNFERGRFVGSARIPQCNKASIVIQIEAKEGTTSVKFDLILYRTLEWRISAFFRCIGQKKHGEKLTMNWGTVIGSKGRAYIKQRSYTNQNGEEKFINDVDRFIDYNEDFFDDLPF